MVPLLSQRQVIQARRVNLALVVCVIIMSVFVDGNGRIFGLPEETSNIIAAIFFSSGILLSCILSIFDKGHRITAVLCLAIYLILIFPAIFPL